MSINFFTEKDRAEFLQIRKGEVRLGEQIQLCKGFDLSALTSFKAQGGKYVLLGIPECIGVLGNSGIVGAQNAWEAFLKTFMNIQANRFLTGEKIMLLGSIATAELLEASLSLDPKADYYLQKQHMLCAQLDELIWPVLQAIFKTGLLPIVIGGGHNNAYPILKGAFEANKESMNVINLDAHADFRPMEGRHSGNGFTYALQAGYMNRYAVFGLHESYNGENMLKAMDTLPFVHYQFLDQLQYFDKSLSEAIAFVSSYHHGCGVELDIDAIRMMPSSAISPTGFSFEQARAFVRKTAKHLKPSYLHLPEAAPKTEQEAKTVGKALGYLVTDFIKACK